MATSSPKAAGSLSEGDGHWTGQALVDGKEVTIVGDEVAGNRLHRVGSHHRRSKTLGVAVGNEGVPFGVDIELHSPHRADVLEDLGQGGYRLVVGCYVEEITASIDADAGAPNAYGVAKCVPPLWAIGVVVKRRV